MNICSYLMENEDEISRLELKTDGSVVERQALWAGIRPGMRVADIGCGSGKTSYYLHKTVHPGGVVTGFDFSEKRIAYAQDKYKTPGLEFQCLNFLDDLKQVESDKFDFIWVRFVLEYYKSEAKDIVQKIGRILKSGGIMCLIDLDFNCIIHHHLPDRLEKTIKNIVTGLMENANFDPYAGRKLYSFLYDLGYGNIKVEMEAHHLIYGMLQYKDSYNWNKKLEIAVSKSGDGLVEYGGDLQGFSNDFKMFFEDPRRFSYTPMILCCGRKP